MPTTGAHDVELYSIGKGILYISTFVSGVSPTWVDLGNAPSIELELTHETLAHVSSRGGVRRKDKEVIVETGYTITFTLDEMSLANLNYFCMGTSDATAETIKGLSRLTQEYSLRFISDNPEGPNQTWTFHRCTIKPNGSMNMISDEWMRMSLIAQGLDDTDNNATSPYFDVAFATTTTTTTTSTTTTTA